MAKDGAPNHPSKEDDEPKPNGMSSLTKLSIFICFLSIIIALWPKTLNLTGASIEEGENTAEKVLRDIYDKFNMNSSTSQSGTLLPNWDDMMSMINGSSTEAYTPARSTRPGYKLGKSGAKAKHPVVLVPGFITSGLEVWSGEECMQNHFRTRIWGGLSMAQMLLEKKDCWLKHLSLHPKTGMDPSEDIRIRSSQGFEAADYFVSNYWVFGKLIENLADVGYDGTNMVMFAYDWRLAFPLLEKRDGFLTKLKLTIEGLVKTTGQKAVILNHSMGSPTTLFFLQWVTMDEKHGGGGGGADWVDKHLHSVVNMAGATLGAPKAVSALLSGEMQETSQIIGTIGAIVEKYFGRKTRLELFHSWGSLWALLPKGGNAIWGSAADVDEVAKIPAGDDNGSYKVSPMITLTGEVEAPKDVVSSREEETCPTVSSSLLETDEVSIAQLRSTIEELAELKHVSPNGIISFLRKWSGGYGPTMMSSMIHHFDSDGYNNSSSKDKDEVLPIEKWHDPTVTPLPYAPDMKMYCLYGTGVPTERAYYYSKNRVKLYENSDSDSSSADESSSSTCANPFQFSDPPFILDSGMHDKDSSLVEYGVYTTDGDGSVPILSMGYMCVDGWIDSPLNPSRMDVIAREYLEQAEFDIKDPLRFGSHSGQHCDILGNVDFLEDVIKIVTDYEPVSSRILSDIENIARRINEHPFGGIKGKKGND